MSNEWSDSEDEDTQIPSQVHLAFIDCPVEEEDDILLEDTFIGGQPIWMHPDSAPKDELVHCDSCGQKMALLLQADAPLADKLYDRVIYIFACKNTAKCSRKKGSVKAFRGILKDKKRMAQIKDEQANAAKKALDEKLQQEDKKKLNIDLSKNLFGGSLGSNPFGTGNPFGSGNPFSKEEKKETKEKEEKEEEVAEVKNDEKDSEKGERNNKPSSTFPQYPAYFLHVEEEKIKKETKLEPELEKYKHLIDADRDDDDDDEPKRGSKSRRESGASLDPNSQKIANNLDDKYFEAFTNIVKHNPGQVLRYDLGGRPLLYSGRDEVFKQFQLRIAVPKAQGLNAPRRFELQLMPKAIMDLEQIDDSTPVSELLNGMSWGTIIVCTDSEDVVHEVDENGVAYEEEWVGVQWEEV